MPSAHAHIAHTLPASSDRNALAAALVALEACNLTLSALRQRCVTARAANALEEASFWLVEEVAPILRHAAQIIPTPHDSIPLEHAL